MASMERKKLTKEITTKTVRSTPVRVGGGVIVGDLPQQRRTTPKASLRTVVRTGGGVIIGNLPR
jgi:hypothetical protein